VESDLSKKIGFFGGSFDPIHLGHLNLAIEIAERHKLDEVYFCPTGQSPFKKAQAPIASKEDRRAMVTAAISPLSQFTLLDLELQKTDPCYTIDTIKTLLSMNGKTKKNYFLLLGEDTLEGFNAWRDVAELVKLATPLVGSRISKSLLKPQGLTPALSSMIEKGITPIPILEISSTEIRARLQKGLYCGHLLPAKVWDYIEQHQLYRASHEKRP
jgi:nicotinate-nucleotide adenylyltransferase